jgi:hypothetical protein
LWAAGFNYFFQPGFSSKNIQPYYRNNETTAHNKATIKKSQSIKTGTACNKRFIYVTFLSSGVPQLLILYFNTSTAETHAGTNFSAIGILLG